MIQTIKKTKQTNKHFDDKAEDAHTKKRKTLKYLEILLNYCYCRFSSQNTCNPKMIQGRKWLPNTGWASSNVVHGGAFYSTKI